MVSDNCCTELEEKKNLLENIHEYEYQSSDAVRLSVRVK